MATMDSSASLGAAPVSSGRYSGGRFGRGAGNQDFELNLAPIIDCLTVLIAFILVGASYLSVGILESSVASAGAVPSVEEKAAPVHLTIDLKQDRSILVLLTGSLNRAHRIEPRNGNWNYNALTDRLAIVKGEWPALQSAILTADNLVDYREVVKSMEITRKAVPSVTLGGF